MSTSRHRGGRHVRVRPPRRLRLAVPSTAAAVVALLVVFVGASGLIMHVLRVPTELRQTGGAPTAEATAPAHKSADARPMHTRAARSYVRTSASPHRPTGRPAPAATIAGSKPSASPAPTPTSRPSAHPTPSPSPSGPLPLPTLTPRA